MDQKHWNLRNTNNWAGEHVKSLLDLSARIELVAKGNVAVIWHHGVSGYFAIKFLRALVIDFWERLI